MTVWVATELGGTSLRKPKLNLANTLSLKRQNKNPANILLLFREGVVSDWESLCHALGVPKYVNNPDRYSGGSNIKAIVQNLINAGLLVHKGSKTLLRGSIKVSPKWTEIQMALGVSLK